MPAPVSTLVPAAHDASFDPFRCRGWLSQPERLIGDSGWTQHIPFGMYLVEALRPEVLVELGTHSGSSYAAFCQCIKEQGLPTRAYAVDTWTGDEFAGFYGPDILDDLRRHHDARFTAFSTLLQMTFDNARDKFADGSVDLLHIDGRHSYEAVKHDFESWREKLSDRGVVLFHDTQVRTGEFGVWRLWDEISHTHPSFEFVHGHGLGVLAVGAQPPAELAPFFAGSESQRTMLRAFFQLLGQRLSLVIEERRLAVHAKHLNYRIELGAEHLAAKEAELRAAQEAMRQMEARHAAERAASQQQLDFLREQITREQRILREHAGEVRRLQHTSAELEALTSTATLKLVKRAWAVKDRCLEAVPWSRRLYERLQRVAKSRL